METDEGLLVAKTWLSTGCATGLGNVLAETVLARGDQVVLTARSTDPLQPFASRYPRTARMAKLDVTRDGDAAAAVAFAEKEFGRLDVLVNNAGFGFIGACAA